MFNVTLIRPLNIFCYRSYQVIAMKFNKTTALLQSTSSYTHFKTYSDAGINEPYIAGVFSSSQYQQMKHFTLGKSTFISRIPFKKELLSSK